MKRYIVVLTLSLLCLSAIAEEDYHEFVDQQSRSIVLKIITCDMSGGTVLVERRDHRRLTVKINTFSPDDQLYIKQWYMEHEMLSEKNLRINFNKKTVKKWNEKIMTPEQTTARGVIIPPEQIGVKRFETIAYELVFQNRGDVPISKMRVEYIIFYEQLSTGIKDVDPIQKQLKGAFEVLDLHAREKISATTEAAQIFEEDRRRGVHVGSTSIDDYKPHEAQGRIHGIRAKVYVTLANGDEISRDYCAPSKLSLEKYPWDAAQESLPIRDIRRD